jgi:hypothetical protein
MNKKSNKVKERRGLVAVLTASGLSPSAIADVLQNEGGISVHPKIISADSMIFKRFVDEITPDTPEDAVRMQIGRLEMIQRMALESFLDSKEQETHTIDADGLPVRIVNKKSAGDAKFLVIARDIEIERSKILGVYAAKEEHQSGDLKVTFSWGEEGPEILSAGEIAEVFASDD